MAATFGAGTITMPYVFCVSGIGLGTLLTIIGACLGHYTGNLLAKCADLTGMRSYEDFAEIAFRSKQWRVVVTTVMITALLGVTTAYISLSKTMIPRIIEVTVSDTAY